MLQTKLVNEELKAWTIQQRRHFHMHPELSGQEYETAAYVKEKLAEFGIPVDSRFSVPNVVAYFKGTEGNKTVALRADMDALPLYEEGDKPYISTVPGVMHGCGHDGHTAILLAVAKWMSSHPQLVKTISSSFFKAQRKLRQVELNSLLKREF